MARGDIMAALNNAIIRNESIEEAMQTLISAGYNIEDVLEASKQINMGTLTALKSNNPIPPVQQPQIDNTKQDKNNFTPLPKDQPIPENLSNQNPQSNQIPIQATPKKSKSKTILIVLITLLVLFLGILIFFVVFGKAILDLLFK
jgi:ATP-dependent Zn protease